LRKYNTFHQTLTEMVAWLAAEGVTHVTMEATGIYWKPIFHALCAAERPLEVLLVNARHVKNVPGRKSDALDAAWLAELTECGLLRGSFIPPPQIGAIRELTRYRKKLIEQRSSELQRLAKVLEDSGIKIDSVASALTTLSARDMIEALIAGERDPAVLADLARGRMRAKIADLTLACAGRFGDQHALMCTLHLEHIDHLADMIARLDARIDEASLPFVQQTDLLATIPGIGERAAQVIISEAGRRGALLRRAPLRTVHATHRRTRLKQAARALRVVVLASCVCGLGARAGRRRVSSGFGSCPACRARHGGRGSRRRLPAGPRSATSVPIPVGTGAAGRW
ncbi:MAG TPA: IS110 family transposase, partial [Propionibacteriaceae bacterium]|nr:IS110 family transposase [Propionibacteriaceae bacterium]